VIRRLADAVLSALLAPPCAVCGRVLDRPLDGAVCDACWTAIAVSAPPFRGNGLVQRAAAIGDYTGVLRDIIHVLKYDGRRTSAPRLAALMVQHGGDVLAGADAVVPVPLHSRRQRERGFNQADDLARLLGLPVARVLRRTRMTAPQVDLPAEARHRNVKGAFELAGQVKLDGLVLVLVDDVTTTGATLEACARVLKRAGTKEIRALTAARVSSALR
jgi:ComF family protein